YMATRYENVIGNWENNTSNSDAVLDGTSTNVFEPWMLNMLKRWHKNDPVSAKEIRRNDLVFEFQGNRNPFIDHPEFVEQIWGN
ncbi:endonuclease, partial [Vibrio sp. 1731]